MNMVNLKYLKCSKNERAASASIVAPNQGILTVSANDRSFARDHVFVYRLTRDMHPKTQGKDVYFAVPNGSRVTLQDVPKGTYRLMRMV